MYFSLSHEFTNTIINCYPLSPNSDENEFQAMRIKKVITKDKILCYLDKFNKKYMENSEENMHFHIRAERVDNYSTSGQWI